MHNEYFGLALIPLNCRFIQNCEIEKVVEFLAGKCWREQIFGTTECESHCKLSVLLTQWLLSLFGATARPRFISFCLVYWLYSTR